MKILNPDIDLELFYHRRKEAPQKVLLLDYDGTLAPFHKEPNKAEPYPGIRQVLNRIMQVPDIRLVIITGRWTKDLLPLLQLEKQPEIWGSHGLERLKTDGSYEIDSMEEQHLDGLVAADEWIEELGLSSRCGGLELRVPGRDKGDAVRTILREANQDGVAAYLGDDLTDEDAFRAIKGKGIGILVREELRPTAADLWIEPPEELLTFLSGWIGED
ncbi:MAG: trehalose-phosphatase [Syntrophobacterales bacterium]